MTISDVEFLTELNNDFRLNYMYGSLAAPSPAGLIAIAKKGKDYWNAWRRRHPAARIELNRLEQIKLRGIDFSGFEFPSTEGKPCVDFSGTKLSKENKFDGAHFGDDAIFVGTIFESASFQSAIFGKNAKFESSRFNGESNFRHSEFGTDANFKSANFEATSFFSNCIFHDRPIFEKTVFAQEAIFIDASIGAQARFAETRFMQNAEFSGCRFGSYLSFSPSSSYGRINFSCTDHAKKTFFSGDSDFGGNGLGTSVDFSGCIFHGKTRFLVSTFGKEARFEKVEFYGNTEFGPTALGRIDFVCATFHQDLIFRDTFFNGETLFQGTIFLGIVDFKGQQRSEKKTLEFQGIRFLGCWFAKGAIFRGRDFKTTALFGRAPLGKERDIKEIAKILSFRTKRHHAGKTVFLGIPDFHGCKFHQDTSFVGTEFEIPPGNDAARAFRTLKLAMEQLKSTHEEQKFFRLEMEADRPTLPGFRPWISRIYQITSDYGFSLWRPVAWLIGLSLMFGMAYGWLANTCGADIACAKIAWKADVGSAADRTSAVIKYTLASVSPVPGLDRMQTELRAPLFGHHGWIPITALVLEILHKIVALVMAFLFALALRNLFKMKS